MIEQFTERQPVWVLLDDGTQAEGIFCEDQEGATFFGGPSRAIVAVPALDEILTVPIERITPR